MTTEFKRPTSQKERREVMPISSELTETFYRAFDGLHSFTAEENGYRYEYLKEER
jgi:hypothetical protein